MVNLGPSKADWGILFPQWHDFTCPVHTYSSVYQEVVGKAVCNSCWSCISRCFFCPRPVTAQVTLGCTCLALVWEKEDLGNTFYFVLHVKSENLKLYYRETTWTLLFASCRFQPRLCSPSCLLLACTSDSLCGNFQSDPSPPVPIPLFQQSSSQHGYGIISSPSLQCEAKPSECSKFKLP